MNQYLRYPSVYHDRLYFTISGDIWMKIGEQESCLITNFGYCKSLCANDKKLAFISNISGGNDIYLYDFQSKNVERITYKNIVSNIICWHNDYLIFSSYHASAFGVNKLFYINPFKDKNVFSINIGYANFISFAKNINQSNNIVISKNGYGYSQWKGYRGGAVGEILVKLSDDYKNIFSYHVDEQQIDNVNEIKNDYPMSQMNFQLIEDKNKNYFDYLLGNPEQATIFGDRVFFISENDGSDCIEFDKSTSDTYVVQQRNIYSFSLNEFQKCLSDKSYDNFQKQSDNPFAKNDSITTLSQEELDILINDIKNSYQKNKIGLQILQHTFHEDFSVREFSICSISHKLVYSCGGKLWNLNLLCYDQTKINQEISELPKSTAINVLSQSIKYELPKYINSSEYLHDFDISNECKNISIITRGNLFVMNPWLSGANHIQTSKFMKFKLSKLTGDYIIAVVDDGKIDQVIIYHSNDLSNPCLVIEYDFGLITSISLSRNGVYLAISNHKNELYIVKILYLKKISKPNENESNIDIHGSNLSKIESNDSSNKETSFNKMKIANQNPIYMSKNNINNMNCNYYKYDSYRSTPYNINDLSDNQEAAHTTSLNHGNLNLSSDTQEKNDNHSEDEAKFSYILDHTIQEIDENGMKIQDVLFVNKSIQWIDDYDWSFCNRYFTYTYYVEECIANIMFFDLNEKKNIQIIENGFVNDCPRFCPSGKYLYFFSRSIFRPEWASAGFSMFFQNTSKPYLLMLRNGLRSPFSIGDTAFDDEGKFNIDFENISNRILPFPVEADDFVDLFALNGKVMWSTKEPNKLNEFSIDIYDFSTLKEDECLSGVLHAKLSSDGKWVIYVTPQGKVRVVKAGEKPDSQESYKNYGWIDLTRINLKIDKKSEMKFIFDEVIRLPKEFFWSEKVASCLPQVAEKYMSLVNTLAHRNDLNEIIKEFHGELMCSHAYILENGDNDAVRPQYLMLGAEFVYSEINYLNFSNDVGNQIKNRYGNEAYGYKIQYIYKGDINEISVFDNPDVMLSVDDFIMSINGVMLNKNLSPEMILERFIGPINITAITKDGIKDVIIHNPRAINRTYIYKEWVRKNRDFVHKISQNKVGYIHIPDMSEKGFSEFSISFANERLKSSIIIDTRFNEGGNVSTLILEKLMKIRLGYDTHRWNNYETDYPYESRRGKMVFLCNELTASDGDMFIMAVKDMKLGTIIGKRTWGGVVGIHPKFSLIDGGLTSQPEYAFRMHSGKKVENVGVHPDIYVDFSIEDSNNPYDPQLITACYESMK